MYENNEIVKQWLKRYLLLSDDINSLIMRAEALRERATSPRTFIIDGMPHSSSKDIDRIGNLIALCDSIEAEAKKKIVLSNNIYYEIDTTIKRIKGPGSADKKLVLQMRYLDGFAWEDISSTLWLSKTDFLEKVDTYRRRTFRIHKEALCSLSEFLPDITKQNFILEKRQRNG